MAVALILLHWVFVGASEGQGGIFVEAELGYTFGLRVNARSDMEAKKIM